MGRAWIDDELRQMPAREEQRRLAAERRLHQAALIKQKAPDLMHRLVQEAGVVVDECRHKAGVDVGVREFQPLPHEGFSVTKVSFPRVYLECRPDYEGQVVCCNLSRTDTHESEPLEWDFNLRFTVNDRDAIELRHDDHTFHDVDEALEFLLKPVLFPPLEQPI